MIATLPVKPVMFIPFVLYDNSVNKHSENTIIDGNVDLDGNIKIFAFSDKANIAPMGTFCFLASD